jgi:hypothetical protein
MKKYDKSTPGEWRARKDRGNSKNGPCSYAVVDESNHTVALWGNRANMQLMAQAKALRRELVREILKNTPTERGVLFEITTNTKTDERVYSHAPEIDLKYITKHTSTPIIAASLGPDWKPEYVTLEVLRELAEEE